MKRQLTSLLSAGVSLFAIVLGTAAAQSQQAAPQPSTSTAPSQTPQGQPAPAVQQTPAKVWTNDEIDGLRTDHGVSVVGTNPPTKNATATSKVAPQEKDPAWYRLQILSLQAEIDKLDAQIAKLQAFLNGENVGETASISRKMTPTPQDQLKKMEAQRQADATKLEDLLDRARHNGIQPGALR